MHNGLLQAITQRVSLNSEEQQRIALFFAERTVKKKDYLLRTGEISHYATFVVGGCFAMYSIDSTGKEHVTHIAAEGWWVGDIHSFHTHTPSPYVVQALEHSQVLQISKQQFDILCNLIPAVDTYFRILVQNAYTALQRRIVLSMSTPAAERYQEFCNAYPALQHRVPLHIIASYLGIRPEFLSRIRKKLSKSPYS